MLHIKSTYNRLVCILLLTYLPQTAHCEKIAILGDSLSTGAGTHSNITFDHLTMWNILTGKISLKPTAAIKEKLRQFGIPDTRPPKFLWRTTRDFNGPIDWVVSNFINDMSYVYLDTEILSWGYLVGRKLGVEPDSIYIAGENGARMINFTRQLDRVIDGLGGKLPDKIFVLYTGNDLCAHNQNLMTDPLIYGQQLAQGLSYLARNGKPPAAGTDVYVLSFLNISQILTKPSILQAKIQAHGETVTCKEIRKRRFQPQDHKVYEGIPTEGLYISQMLPPNPTQICPTLFAMEAHAKAEIGLFSSLSGKERETKIKAIIDEKVSNVASLIRRYRAEAERIVAATQSSLNHTKIRFHYLANTADVTFDGEDMADDCFHIKLSGHEKIAQQVLAELGQDLTVKEN